MTRPNALRPKWIGCRNLPGTLLALRLRVQLQRSAACDGPEPAPAELISRGDREVNSVDLIPFHVPGLPSVTLGYGCLAPSSGYAAATRERRV